ncbi:MAG: hypothetical protein GF329_01475 [Candidatus Lokiarchaeota archaeon]|nr:hypothetical protein [Candidatus Lokiarchaeota archaeon]
MTKAQKFSATFAAVIDGISPALFAIICLLPYFFGVNLPPSPLIFSGSLIITYIVLFFLGVFLGRVSKKNILVYGIKMATAGIVVALLFIFFPTT